MLTILSLAICRFYLWKVPQYLSYFIGFEVHTRYFYTMFCFSTQPLTAKLPWNVHCPAILKLSMPSLHCMELGHVGRKNAALCRNSAVGRNKATTHSLTAHDSWSVESSQ